MVSLGVFYKKRVGHSTGSDDYIYDYEEYNKGSLDKSFNFGLYFG